jgi:cobalt/nickel transport system permease protein
MHLPDHYLDPTTAAATAALSGGAVAYAIVRLRREPTVRIAPIAATSAFIFAAQMVNFPIAGGASGHLVGGALAGILLGPWAGLIAMTSVLAVQAIILGDGGIAALGANILNMGVLCVLVGAACRAVPLIRRGTSRVHQAIAAAIAAWLSVVLAALACAIEMVASGVAAAAEVIPAMLGIHALIGLPEAAISAAVIALAGYATSPRVTSLPSANHHLASSHAPPSIGRQCKWAFAMAAILIALSPFASTLPDGLERVAANLNLPHHHAADVAPASADE